MAILKLARPLGIVVTLLAVARSAGAHHTGSHAELPPPKWSIHATVIEAVNGPWPCSHQAMSPGVPCRYNRAIRIERGEFGDISLTGTTLWMAGERRESTTPDFHEWGEIAFDPSVMLEQQTALLTVVRALYPIQYMALTVDTPQVIEWSVGEDEASARVAEGSIAELLIEKSAVAAPPPLASSGPRYGAAARIEKLLPMQSRVQAYREAPNAFDVGGGFGFVATFDLSSDDVKPAEAPPPTAPH